MLSKFGSWIQRTWSFFYNREWAGLLGFLTFLLINAESLFELVSGEVNKAGDKFNPSTLLVILATILIRYNVWSNNSVKRVAEAEYEAGRVNAKV